MMGWTEVVVAVLVASAPEDAPADGITVVGETPGELSAIERQFEGALRRNAGPRFAPGDPACVDGVCPRLVVTVSERERDYEIAAEITWPDGRTTSASSRCTICTAKEAGVRAATDAIALLDGAPVEAMGHLAVTSTPSGASVEIDGTAMGRTPLRVELPAGEHVVVVRMDGRRPLTRHVELEAGVDAEVALELARAPHLRPQQVAGWSLVGVGVAGIATGIGLLVLDESPVKNDCSGTHVDRFGNCEFRWNTRGAGIGLLVPGILAAAAGATLVGLDARRHRDPKRAVARLGVGVGRATFSLRF